MLLVEPLIERILNHVGAKAGPEENPREGLKLMAIKARVQTSITTIRKKIERHEGFRSNPLVAGLQGARCTRIHNGREIEIIDDALRSVKHTVTQTDITMSNADEPK